MQQSIPEIIRTIPLGHYLILSAALFVIGMMGVLFRRNIIIVFMSIEIMLNAVNLMFAAVSAYHSDPSGQIMVFFTMAVAAAEVAVGLAIIVMMYKNLNTTNVDLFHNLRG
ncbi:MAG: NADH-quinone oxidoreductase subunit NuoK [Saprospiraceae bacterium]|jgi:NADH-quinone oxidoreductase subunit K|nr:NADH-quinone oxidoreductase subunit NuoK [Saprospiraceae bacterium]MBK7795634.1 NADH-quinone oxidoreductase subunit NuoK [Saprospiraceae bacterium]MBK8154154.1 NADH-quinone oxidoreductase subunit NuoK [Saprospiraceae bacterium]MBK9379590.1 NADH-quinone oxidoreductase subunit NuoK [Saprospiraceae bacterium]MBL0260745.1 NADH-quinone oxidoreductase subunit NuoK [Saprospiraceae bacterium]